ncbi:MAG: hypothetical protein DLM68_06990 [Hyphomicrobiales bacterium]|nr:MAG: hypothetical protein DLM68_06990 [Hyphomicrobiales bacterium]
MACRYPAADAHPQQLARTFVSLAARVSTTSRNDKRDTSSLHERAALMRAMKPDIVARDAREPIEDAPPLHY